MLRIRDEVHFIPSRVKALERISTRAISPSRLFFFIFKEMGSVERADLPVREKDLYWNALSSVVSDVCLHCKP